MTVSHKGSAGHRPQNNSTKVLRREIERQLGIGVMVMTSERIDEILQEHGIATTDHLRRTAIDMLTKRYGWAREKYTNLGSLMYNPLIPPERLDRVRRHFIRACEVLARKKEELRLREEAYKRQALLSRLERKAELIHNAPNNRTPMDEYIFRAAQKCGLVHGYCWPQ